MFRRLPKPALFACGAILSLVWVASSCNPDDRFPGESMGTFRFKATLSNFDDGAAVSCDKTSELPKGSDAGFEFEGIFSQVREEAPEAWFTINGLSRVATFDGQIFVSTHSAPRRFEVSDCDGGFLVEETLRVAILSESQARHFSALNDGGASCPTDIDARLQSGDFDVDPDGGVLAPAFSAAGFDAIHACGVLIDVLIPQTTECNAYAAVDDAGTTSIIPCTATYRVDGARKQ